MASSSDPFKQEAAIRKQNNKAPFKFLIPLVYAPVLPLIRIGLRKNPVVRDRLFTAVLAGAFAHGFYLVIWWIYVHEDLSERRYRKTVVLHLSPSLKPLEGVENSIIKIKIGTIGAYFIGYLLLIIAFRTDLYDAESK